MSPKDHKGKGFFNQFRDEAEFNSFVDLIRDVVKEAMLEVEEPPTKDVLKDRLSKRAMLKDSELKLGVPEQVKQYPSIYAKWKRGPEVG